MTLKVLGHQLFAAHWRVLRLLISLLHTWKVVVSFCADNISESILCISMLLFVASSNSCSSWTIFSSCWAVSAACSRCWENRSYSPEPLSSKDTKRPTTLLTSLPETKVNKSHLFFFFFHSFTYILLMLYNLMLLLWQVFSTILLFN